MANSKSKKKIYKRDYSVKNCLVRRINFEGNQFVELRYMVADNVGLVLRGIYNDKDEFILDYYYPTYLGESISSNNEVDVIKQSDKECYHVMVDELRLGVNLIFHLQNK